MLTRTEMVLDRTSENQRYVRFCNEAKTVAVYLSPEDDEDMGRPEQVTVRVTPGDGLNDARP